MGYRIAADAVLLVHLAFIVFVVVGGLLAIRWKRLAFIHVPAVLWAAMIELRGWICPLTPLEQSLREAAGGPAYSGGFIDRYLEPVIYPAGLTRNVQITLSVAVVAFNLIIYLLLMTRAYRKGKRNG
jgi:hypothetical protein